MFQRASVGASEKTESAEMGGGRGASLLLHLGIVGSAYNTPQQMIRFSDEKESFNFLFFVIILSIFGIRGGRNLLILGGPDPAGWLLFLSIVLLQVFLPTMVISMFYGPKSIAPRLQSPATSPWHRRLSWGHDLPQHPEEEYLARPRELEDDAGVEQMLHLLCTGMAKERCRFDRINRCLRWTVVSFVAWAALIMMTINQ